MEQFYYFVDAADNDVHLSKSQATEIVNDVIKNVELNPETATPIFKYDLPGWHQETLRGTKNIAENITGGGQFKADKKEIQEQLAKQIDSLPMNRQVQPLEHSLEPEMICG